MVSNTANFATMSAMVKIIDGKQIAEQIYEWCEIESNKLRAVSVVPKLIIITYNPDVPSRIYVNLKLKKAQQLGIECELLDWSGASFTKCKIRLQKLATDDSVSAIVVQLPTHNLNQYQKLLNIIPVNKDVDGLSEKSLSAIQSDTAKIIPATPKAILTVLRGSGITLDNKNIVIIGQGKLVGLPLGIILKNQGCNVTTANSVTANLSELTKVADVVISATGKPAMVKGGMLKAGAVVLDAGAAEQGGKLVGDVDYASVEPIASIISKVPGGIGPVTVACMLQNVIEAAKNS